MLTDTELKKLKQTEKTYKVADRDGMYVSVATSGTKSFRYDYRINGRRETLTIGRYDENLSSKVARGLEELEYGISLTLAEARMLLADARRSVEKGESPSRAKAKSALKLPSHLLLAVGQNATSQTRPTLTTERDLQTQRWLCAAPFTTAILSGHLES